MKDKLLALGGKLKDNRIYITGIWEQLLKAKVVFSYQNHNNRLTSFTIDGKEVIRLGADPKANERTRRDILTFRKSMAYAYYDVAEGEFKCVNGADLIFLPKFNLIAFMFHGRLFKVKI